MNYDRPIWTAFAEFQNSSRPRFSTGNILQSQVYREEQRKTAGQ